MSPNDDEKPDFHASAIIIWRAYGEDKMGMAQEIASLRTRLKQANTTIEQQRAVIEAEHQRGYNDAVDDIADFMDKIQTDSETIRQQFKSE